MNHDISYIRSGVKGLEMIAPLWMKLNEFHKERSLKFSDHFNRLTWEKRKSSLIEKAQQGNMLVECAKNKGVMIGYCVSSVVDGTGEVESIFIEKEFRGCGIGDTFMKRALKWMDAQNVARKVVSVAVGNEEAFGFYQRYGFYPRATILMQVDTNNASL